MGLRATLQLAEQDALSALQAGDHDMFFSFIYPDQNLPQWVDENPLDLDKAWHVIHFLVTGDTSTTLLLSGVQVDGISEHLEFHPHEAVSKLCHSLEGKDAGKLLSTVSISELNELGIYDRNWDEAALPYLREKLTGFLKKIRDAETSDRGIFVSII